MIVPNFCDMAHFNPVNFTEIVNAGMWGISHKARQGTGYGDPEYSGRMKLAKQVGLLWCAYDFATGDPVAANVADFLSYAILQPNDAAMLDFEDNTELEMTADEAYQWIELGEPEARRRVLDLRRQPRPRADRRPGS